MFEQVQKLINSHNSFKHKEDFPSTHEDFIEWYSFERINAAMQTIVERYGGTFKPIKKEFVHKRPKHYSDIYHEGVSADQSAPAQIEKRRAGEENDTILLSWPALQKAARMIRIPVAIQAIHALVHESVHWNARERIENKEGKDGVELSVDESGFSSIEEGDSSVTFSGEPLNEALTERIALTLFLRELRAHSSFDEKDISRFFGIEQINKAPFEYIHEQTGLFLLVEELALAREVTTKEIWQEILTYYFSGTRPNKEVLQEILSTPNLSERGKLLARWFCVPVTPQEWKEIKLFTESDPAYKIMKQRLQTIESVEEFDELLHAKLS